MIWMNRKHPSFDMGMELLMSVPMEPDFVRLPDLRDDLIGPGERNPLLHANFQKSGSIQDLLRNLSRRGYTVQVRNGLDGYGRQLSLPRDSHWEVEAAKLYWKTVYRSTENETCEEMVTGGGLGVCDGRRRIGLSAGTGGHTV